MSDVRRVLHVIDSLDLGGAQTFLLDLVTHLDRSRYEPEVASMHGRGVYAAAFESAGITTHVLSPKKWPPYYVLNFWNLLRRERYDILHFHLFGANLCAKPLAIAQGHRAIVVHDQCNDASRERNPVLLAADALANRGVPRIIAVSGSVYRYLLDREDVPDSKLAMIPNGIDAGVFSPATDDQRKEARRTLGIPLSTFVIGGIGRLVEQKNFDLILEVAFRTIRVHPEVLFVIAGTGPLEQQLREKVERSEYAASIRFLGHVGDRTGLFHALDAMLMTSDFEGTPMALLEAMASGIPVVASAVDGIAEVCTDNWNGLLVPPRNLKGFCSALEKIIRDPEMRHSLGMNARRTILERYEISSLVKGIESVYDEVLAS
jgi:glycosyltransferase involved in cell wall biosynthesis